MRKWKVLARHKWVNGATITESVDVNDTGEKSYRRFTATIRGFQNWRIFEGYLTSDTAQDVMNRVLAIRERIDSGDEVVFSEDVAI